MSDTQTQSAPGTNAPADPPAAAAAPKPPEQQPAAKPPTSDGDPHWLKPRLDDAKKTGASAERTAIEAQLQSKYGIKLDDLDAKLARLKELETQQLSDAERSAARIAELEPLAAQAAEYREAYRQEVESRFNSLPEPVRKAIDAEANGDPKLRAAYMRVASAFGGSASMGGNGQAQVQQAPPAAPPPATTGPPGTPPQPGTPQTAWERWVAMPNGIAKGIFYQTNRREVDATKPRD